MKHGNNRGAIFEPSLSVEAWRAPCTHEQHGAVHVDVTFLEARLGEEPDSKVRFKLSLKSVVLKITASAVDPIKVVPSSVDRGPIVNSNSSETVSTELGASVQGGLSAQMGAVPIKAQAGADGRAAFQKQTTVTTSQTLRLHDISQYKVGDSYCWSISSHDGQVLQGKVWDPVTEPRCSLALTSQNADSGDCEVRLDVQCKREDISLTSIELKESKKISLFKSNNIAAAEAVLRELLADKGLQVRDISEPYENIQLTSISIAEE